MFLFLANETFQISYSFLCCLPSFIDKGVRIHSHDCGNDVLCVVPTSANLDEAIHCATDEDNATLESLNSTHEIFYIVMDGMVQYYKYNFYSHCVSCIIKVIPIVTDVTWHAFDNVCYVGVPLVITHM